jgi:hypothetical protein
LDTATKLRNYFNQQIETDDEDIGDELRKLMYRYAEHPELQAGIDEAVCQITGWTFKTFCKNAGVRMPKSIDPSDAQHPSRQKAIKILERISEMLGNEDIFDNAKGKKNIKPDGTWYEYEDTVTDIIEEKVDADS